ncbi:zinc-finger domain-containing protein [Neobacillus rhizosphaerae]|uniref:zinc-finger domain-containing protein n=1 Tax=Neobacillus rhizosphaerae TaxID=2880965 RepID=UPI003D273DE5
MRDTDRKELLNHLENVMVHYCDGCFLHQHVKNEGGRRAAHRFCITECTIGEKLQELGKKLS